MIKILEVFNLKYQDFNEINISFNRGTFYSIVGSSNSGKTTLFKLLSRLIPTNDMICCDEVYLNDNNYQEYLKKIGIVERLNNKSFIFKNVLDEMKYPLYNLGYTKTSMMDRINKASKFFKIDNLLDKSIVELNCYEKQKLLIVISLLHNPKVLLLDSVLDFFPKKELNELFVILKKLVNKGLTVISFTKKLDTVEDRVILLDKYSIIGDYSKEKIYEDDKLFYSNNLDIPFITDLSIKLKMYGLVDKEYDNLKELVDDIWP